MGFVAVCAYLSHATLQNLQACLRLQEVFFWHCWCEGKTNTYSLGGKTHIWLDIIRHHSQSRLCSQLRRFLHFRTVGRLVFVHFPASPALAATSVAVMLCSFWRIRNVSAGPTTLETQTRIIWSGIVKFQIARCTRRRFSWYLILMKLLVVRWILSASSPSSFTPSYKLSGLQEKDSKKLCHLQEVRLNKKIRVLTFCWWRCTHTPPFPLCHRAVGPSNSVRSLQEWRGGPERRKGQSPRSWWWSGQRWKWRRVREEHLGARGQRQASLVSGVHRRFWSAASTENNRAPVNHKVCDCLLEEGVHTYLLQRNEVFLSGTCVRANECSAFFADCKLSD